MEGNREWQGRTGGGTFGQKALFFIFRYVPVTFLYPVLLFVIPFYLFFGRKNCKAIYDYFHKILGYKKWKSFCSVIKNHWIFGQIVLDRFAIIASNKTHFKVDVDGNEHYWEVLEQPQGAIVTTAHIGCFEVLGHFFSQDRKPINVVVFAGENQQFSQNRARSFAKGNVKMIPILPDLSHLFFIKNALENGELLTIACDRGEGGKSLQLPFLGVNTSFPTSTFHLAVKMNVPVLVAFAIKIKRTHYKGFFYKLQPSSEGKTASENVEALTRSYVKCLEEILKQYPEQWFNYYDFWNLNKK